MNGFISKIDTAIRTSFYILFFAVPLVMYPTTYELFEFNKMWVVFGFTVFITCLWAAKMVANGQFKIRRTPLDIPILLFLASQVISTIFSMEPHTSLWGYYSRFNGGLFSTISYILLYYAFVTNLVPENKNDEETKPISYKLLLTSLLSGLAVTLWGLPSHFGYDPTCLLFRDTLDVNCWTADFQPTVRIFSTLGQPNWMGTFLAALIPISIGFGIQKIIEDSKKIFVAGGYLILAALFYLALLYTRSQSSFVGLALGIIIFTALFVTQYLKGRDQPLIKNKPGRLFIIALAVFAVTTFLAGSPIESINKYLTLSGIMSQRAHNTAKQVTKPSAGTSLEGGNDIQLGQVGGTESSKIRLIVWKGALELFKQHPLIGTGVETYAYAYYQVKPVEHNLTSEWDYLYNKAHNEYLNYLATTGILGLGSYMLMIAVFIFYAIRLIIKKARKRDMPVLFGILAGYIAILISNFFGFSVVIINLFLFLFPALFFEIADDHVLQNYLAKPAEESNQKQLGMGRMALIGVVVILFFYFEVYLANFWLADKQYALGYNLDKATEFTQAYTPLTNAVKMLPSEDLYKDELSINLATLSVLLAQNNQATQAAQFAQQAQAISDAIIAAHPNNITYYKTRIRVQYALAQLNPKFIDAAILTAEQARKLAPTDAKLAYNEALFYNQKGDNEKMIQLLDQAIKLKPNYVDPYYAKALLYQQLAKDNPSKSAEYTALARQNAEFILNNIDPTNQTVKDLLKKL